MPVPCIDTVVANHLKVFFWDVLHQERGEFQDRYSTFHIGIVFMTVVVEGDSVGFRVIFIDALCSYDRSSEITPDVLRKGLHISQSGFCVDIEAFVMDPVHSCFYFFEGGTETLLHKVEEDSAESIAEVGIVEVADIAPCAVIGNTAF